MQSSLHEEVTLLVVEDEQPLRKLLQQAFQHKGYSCLQASNGEEALDVLNRVPVDVVMTDIGMPKMDGIELTKKIKTFYDLDVIMMTGHINDLSYADAIAQGASDFIQKPLSTKELCIRLERVLQERAMRHKLQRALQQSRQILEGVIHALSLALEARDPYTSGHQRRVAKLGSAMAKEMELSEERISGIQMAGAIHDLGKIAIPAEILSKPTRLTKNEFDILKTHAQIGYDILKDINFPFPIAEIVHQHHERLDGSGYPQGLSGEDILLEARIMAVADVVEAMSSHRPYRPAQGIDSALQEIEKNKGVVFDPDCVNACLKLILEQGFSFGQ